MSTSIKTAKRMKRVQRQRTKARLISRRARRFNGSEADKQASTLFFVSGHA